MTTDPMASPIEKELQIIDDHEIAADSGVPYSNIPYIVVELASGDIPSRGSSWSQILHSRGIPNTLLQTTDIISNPRLINNSPAIFLDGSLGSSNGNAVPQSLVDIFIKEDTTLILTGHSAWLLHRLSGRDPPSQTAPAETTLIAQPEYAGAVFLSHPESLSLGSTLTSESSLALPVDELQTERSRLVNLTGTTTASNIASIRYDSYPLDIFLFSAENPSLLTPSGQGLLENIIAFSTALSESTTSIALGELQSNEGTLLAGGMSYWHEPTIASTYYAVHTIKSLLTGAAWSNWVATNAPLVSSILSDLLVDYGSETGFMTSQTEAIVDCRSTSQALWLISKMDLSSQFPVSEIVSYLSSRQSPDGGFENYITTTYHVAEALWTSGQLTSIDTYQLELWLRSLVIDGSKTSNPDLWGSIGSNPTSTSPLNNYATEYLRALSFLGKAHPDPSKLTSWILTRTSNGDGSFRNSIGLDEEVVTGTASALVSMQILGTLSSQNKSLAMSWFADNQLVSGGFGLKDATSDLVGKTRETSRVATCLETLGETSGSLAIEVISFIDSIKTDAGFEAMDLLPSLMWTSWLLEASRFTHASDSVNLSLAREYITNFNKLTIYPFWSNLTATTSPEYSIYQYRTKSVWTQYFGVTAGQALGVDLGPNVVSDAVLYLSQSQYMTGHYRPTSLSGTAHMQHSVAAVETLFLLDELDTILYRTNLENAILSEYSSGSWSTLGWTLRPFAGSQNAIDYLSTRAAIRLGIVTPTMATEIASNIESRLQYSDLLALSWDVATLSLLQTSAFSVDLESVDTSLVLSALRSSHFMNGWFNSSELWQPIYTKTVFQMVSTLGLRCLLDDVPGVSLSTSVNPTGELGSVLDISVVIQSTSASHSVVVNLFEETLLFRNVANVDTLQFPISSDRANLGVWNATLMILDWGSSRAFDRFEVLIEGSLEGTMNIFTPVVKVGELVNGSTQWTLAGGADAGISHIIVRLGNSPTYHQWSYDALSPFSLSLPTADFDAGIYSLNVTVVIPDCPPLIFLDEVVISEPNPTYMQTVENTDGKVGEELTIDWSLHFQENATMIGSQFVTLSIRDSTDTIVFSDTLISNVSGCIFRWTPSSRGNFVFSLSFTGNGTLDSCQVEGAIHAYEETSLLFSGTGTMNQYSTSNLQLFLATNQGEVLSGQNVHVVVISPASTTIIDSWFITNGTGYINIAFSLTENGIYALQAQFSPSAFLLGAVTSDSVISWSSSSLELGGLGAEELIGNTYRPWALLRDSISNPVTSQQVLIRITLLPSTILVEQLLITNSSGCVSVAWVASAAGAYRFEATFSGTPSRASVTQSIDFQVIIPVTLNISTVSNSEVGSEELIQVTARNHLGELISGISVTVTVRGPGGVALYTNTSLTLAGSITLQWIPSVRGANELTVTSPRQGLYQAALSTTTVDIYEIPQLDLELPIDAIAPTTDSVTVSLEDHDLLAIEGVTVHILIQLDAMYLIDGNYVTDNNGQASIILSLSTPGILHVEILLSAQDWLLETSTNSDITVQAATELIITIPGQPVEQGSTVGVLVALTNFAGAPLVGATIQIEVAWNNGTILRSVTRTTDAAGQCILAQAFLYVGDFTIRASYTGYGLNASASNVVPQRVFVTPSIYVAHDPSSMTGNAMEFQVNLTDALGNYIIGRTIELRIEQDGVLVFQAQILSEAGFSIITWYPTQGGLVTITVTHLGNIYYLTTSTVSSASILELVSGSLSISPTEIDLFDSTTLVYTLESVTPKPGVTIHFEVLGMDLVPVWSADIPTNSTGMASVVYTAVETYGVLHVSASPITDEFLIGGDVQEQLVVKTFCRVSVTLLPAPASVQILTNITIFVLDDLNGLVDGPTVIVSLYDPYGEIVKLGQWTNSITVPIEEGLAIVDFTPAIVGLYSVVLSSSGSVSVRGFASTTYHTIYSITQLELTLSTNELEVGQTLDMTAQLLDQNDMPLVGRNVVLYLDGPGSSSFGPLVFVTNSTGHVIWSVTLDDEGLWIFIASFSGLGVYLPASADAEINVRYGTVIDFSLVTSGDIIAGQTNTAFSILLTDTGGTPLEGFTVHYEVHHETLGLVFQGNLIQTDTNPIILNLTFERMGNYTMIVSFSGTSHYHPSNAGLQLAVLGTTEAASSIPEGIDRASETGVQIVVLDEVSSPILLSELDIIITLQGPDGLENLAGRLEWNESSVTLYTQGFTVGSFVLNVTILPTNMRLGSISFFNIDITSSTHLTIKEETLSGLISEQHSLEFLLLDSLSDAIDNAEVWVSLYDPLGREIYGHPLTTRTLLHSSLEGTEVSWTPNLVGEYRVVLIFEGDDFLNATSLQLIIHVLHVSSISVDGPSQSDYGEIVPFSITLAGALGGISGANVTIQVLTEGVIVQEISLVTGSRGIVSTNLVGLLAGIHVINVTFAGSATQANCSASFALEITPVVVVTIETVGTLYVGQNCSVDLSVSVLGSKPDWNGTLTAVLYSPTGSRLATWSFGIDPYSILRLDFQSFSEGTHTLNVTLSGLPVAVARTYPMAIVIARESLSLQLDASTTPMFGGLGILAIVGFAMRKKMRNFMGMMPGEWNE